MASVDTGRGVRDILRIYDTAGLMGTVQVRKYPGSMFTLHSYSNQIINDLIFICIQLPRHYLQFPDGFILVYDPCDSTSLDMLAGIKADIDKNKDKKEVSSTYDSNANVTCDGRPPV